MPAEKDCGPMDNVNNQNTSIILLRDVHKIYELGEMVPALDGVSLTLSDGSYTAVMGPSGSGKSTLLNLIGCLDQPTSGTVHINGVDVTRLSDNARTEVRRDKIGFIFQEFNLMSKLTAVENVSFPLAFRGVSRQERHDRANELLAMVDLAERGDHRPNQLSGGQRQRVAIARALANDPVLLLADEPTGSLDSKTGARIMTLFEKLHNAGNTIILVTHERHIAEHADSIIHFHDGSLERIEDVAETTSTEHVEPNQR